LLKVETAADIPRRLSGMQAVREIAAAAGALFAYVTTVLPRVRRVLEELGPLPEAKARNAEAVAVFATLVPRRRRAAVVRAIVALQVAIDLRDESEESGAEADTERLKRLEERWRREVERLPSYEAVRPRLKGAIERCVQGQLHTHRAAEGDSAALRSWAEGLPNSSGYRWWEAAAGASSSVTAHALIAAAASERTSDADADAIDAAYNPPIGALTVLLDDLVDLEADRAAGEHNYLGYYTDAEEAAERLAQIAAQAERASAHLPRRDRHRAILAGVAAHYLSDRRAGTAFAGTIRERILGALGPATRFLASFSRLRRRRQRKRPGQAGVSPGP
jgi:tetraprenyl-beta-curcumene synthase